MEFHPQTRSVGESEPIHCIFEPQQLVDGQLLIAMMNYTDRGYYIKNSEPLGFLTSANTLPFFDAITTIEHEQLRAGSAEDPLASPRPDDYHHGQLFRRRFCPNSLPRIIVIRWRVTFTTNPSWTG